MAKDRVRYLTTRPGAAGAPVRYYWQPKTALQRQGWKPRRIPADFESISDPAALQAAAIAAALALNAELDAWRSGAAPATTASPAMIPPARSVRALIKAYEESPEFKRLAATSQRVYKQSLRILEAWAGDAPIASLTTPRFRKYYLQMQEKTPAKANGFARVSGALFKWARLAGGWGVRENPTAELGLIGLDPSGRIWPREAVEAFVAVADELGYHSLGTAVVLDEWLGQRQSDILRLRRNVLQPAGHALRQGKVGVGLLLPVSIVPSLVTRVEAELAWQGGKGIHATRLIVNAETGQPYQTDTFRHHFAIVRAKLAERTPFFTTDYLCPGVDPGEPDAFKLMTEDLWYMHLRHTAITRLAEARCSVAEISAISGHSKKSIERMLELYLIRTGQLARQAFTRRLEAERPPGEGREQA